MKYNLIMVNYLNSKPFIFGLEHCGLDIPVIVDKDTPAQCALKFGKNEYDIALIPSGYLPYLEDYKIITDYCIGCDGEVRTVGIFSNKPLEECKYIVEDEDSKTSILLSKLIVKEYLGLDISFVKNSSQLEDEAFLYIGDKVFQNEKNFTYYYDLGSLWKAWKNLPFVFAVWVAKDHVPEEICNKLNDAFMYGIKHLPDVIRKESSSQLDLYYYFSHNIQYALDKAKWYSLQLFSEKITSYCDDITEAGV